MALRVTVESAADWNVRHVRAAPGGRRRAAAVDATDFPPEFLAASTQVDQVLEVAPRAGRPQSRAQADARPDGRGRRRRAGAGRGAASVGSADVSRARDLSPAAQVGAAGPGSIAVPHSRPLRTGRRRSARTRLRGRQSHRA